MPFLLWYWMLSCSAQNELLLPLAMRSSGEVSREPIPKDVNALYNEFPLLSPPVMPDLPLEPTDDGFDLSAIPRSCREDMNMCPDALTAMHCLADHTFELSHACMHGVEENLPDYCFLEIDHYDCDGLDVPVIDCLNIHADSLSDNCGNSLRISLHLKIQRDVKEKVHVINGARPSSTFHGCPIDMVNVVDSNRCCTYDITAFEKSCDRPTLRGCIKATCESEGHGILTVTTTNHKARRKIWTYHCCPYEAANGVAEMLWRQSWRFTTQMVLIAMSVVSVLLLVFYVGPQIDIRILRRAPWKLTTSHGINYGTVSLDTKKLRDEVEFGLAC